LRELRLLDTMKSMKTQWLRQWNRWQFLTSQLTLISVLFLYVLYVPNESLVIALFVSISGSTVLAQWIGATLYDRVDHARRNGDFRLLGRAVAVHQLHLAIGIAMIAGGYVGLMHLLGLLQYSMVGVILIGLVAIEKVLSASLRAQATDIVLQAHALRRVLLIAGLLLGILVQDVAWVGELLFGGVIVAVTGSIIRLIIGHLQRFKEVRYQRHYEDSGRRESYLFVMLDLFKRYVHTFVVVGLSLGLVVITTVLYRFVIAEQGQSVLSVPLVLLVSAMAVARVVVATLLPDMVLWKQSMQSNNHSWLRDQTGSMIEQVLYRSLIVGLIWLGTGLILGPTLYGSLALLFATTAVMFVSSLYLLDVRMLSLLRVSQQWTIVLVGLVIFGTNGWLLSMIYPQLSLLVAYVMMAAWFHLSSLYALTQTIDFELRVHFNQSIRMMGIVGISLLVNGVIYWLLLQFPLGVGPVIEQVVFLGLFAIITSVVMYSLTYAFGVHRSLMSRDQLLHQLRTRFIDYEEEEAIW